MIGPKSRPGKRAAFEVNLPECKRGKNKQCHVEKVIRLEAPTLIKSLEPHLAASEQLQKAVDVFQDVLRNTQADLSHGECRKAGDCLITLEARERATHALSSNAREWAPLSLVLGFEFVHITYPEEKTI